MCEKIRLLLQKVIVQMEDELLQKQKNTYLSSQQFCKKTRELLKQEEKYEIDLFEQMTKNKSIGEIETFGYGLSSMQVLSTKRGYYGKTIVTLYKSYHSEKSPQLLPQHCKIQVGDDVALFKNNAIVADGVVYKRVGAKLQVSIRKDLQDDNDIEGLICNVILKWNEVTFRRYFKVLEEMQKSQSNLFDIFFQHRPPAKGKFTKKIQYDNNKLNTQQKEAVSHCLGQTVHLLHGPPGTGKTTTVCELIVEAVKRKEKVLACGPSNIAVDNIVEGIGKRVNCVRIGNPARMIENVIEHCLDYLIAQKSTNWKNEVKKLQSARKRLSKVSKQQKRVLYAQIKQLRNEIYFLQQQAIQQIMEDVDVICCTNVGADDRVFRRYIPKRIFDLVVVDQCGQSLEVACWIPILKGRRVVLAGDHKQLPPTIQGNDNSLLSYTLFSRAMQELVNITSTMLIVQYRMNKAIMGWSNKCFYQNKLKAHETVQSHTLKQLCTKVGEQQESLFMIDTSGCGMGQEGNQNESKLNMGEADLVLALYKKLLLYEVDSKYIAILTPYSKQVTNIKSLITNAEIPIPDISTVDGIQGREKQCIIISLVRSNSKRDIGFLKDWRRMNVAVTRARRMLIIIGNADCASVDPYLASLIQWIQNNGHITSAQQFRGDPNIHFDIGASDKIEKNQIKTDKKGGKDEQGNDSKAKQKKKKKKNIKQRQDDEVTDDRLHSQQEQKALKDHYKKVFFQMMRQLTINNATGFERKMIHQVAEQMDLCHQTSADKKFIKVWKKLTNQQVAQKYAELQRLKQEEQIKQANKKKKKRLQKENKEATMAKKANGPLKYSQEIKNLIGQQQSQQQIEVKTQAIEEQREEEKQEKPLPKKKQKHKLKEQQKQNEQQNIQQIMKQFAQSQPKQNQCFQCKKRITSVTAVQCKFCFTNFCRNHVLAQEHGCGEAAKNQAKKGKPAFDKNLEEATQRLKQKIKDQEIARKRKGKQQKK